MQIQKPKRRRVRRSVIKRRRSRRGYSRARRDAVRSMPTMISIVTVPAAYGEDGFWLQH